MAGFSPCRISATADCGFVGSHPARHAEGR